MTTEFEVIDKNTSTSSKYNSEDISKKIAWMNARIYEYLNKQKYSRSKRRSFGTHLSGLPEVSPPQQQESKKVNWSDFLVFSKETHTSSFPPFDDYPRIDEIGQIMEWYKRLLNIEVGEEYKDPEFVIDEYAVEGVSIEYKEAEALHNRLMDLKKKYGISS